MDVYANTFLCMHWYWGDTPFQISFSLKEYSPHKYIWKNKHVIVAAGVRWDSVAWYCCPIGPIVPLPDDRWI
jgi:hypothetical protein